MGDKSSIGTLPYDIWANIAGFIPPESLEKLYSVNQAFFRFSLDAKYKNLELLAPLDSERSLKRIRKDPFRAGKVHRLKLNLQPFGRFPDCQTFDWRERLKRGFDVVYYEPPKKHKKTKKLTDTESRLILLQNSVDIIRSLPNLQDCVVDDDAQVGQDFELELHRPSFDVDGCIAAAPLVLAAWSISMSSLRRIQLGIAVETLDAIIPAGLKFDNLEHLEITLLVWYRSTNSMAIILSSLLPFVNRHHSTLITFALRSKEHLPLTPLFKQLSTMPRLRNLNTLQGYVSTLQTDTSGLHEFLSRHSEMLQSLSLSFYALGASLVRDPLMEAWDKQPCLHVSYPQLNKLTFGLFDFPDSFGAKIQKSLDSFWTPKLQHLELTMVLSLADIELVFCKELTLWSLLLRCQGIIPEIFSILSAKLPHLLELEYEVFCGDSFPLSFSPDAIELYGPNVTWKLRHLVLKLPSIGEDTEETLRLGISRWFPNLETFKIE